MLLNREKIEMHRMLSHTASALFLSDADKNAVKRQKSGNEEGQREKRIR